MEEQKSQGAVKKTAGFFQKQCSKATPGDPAAASDKPLDFQKRERCFAEPANAPASYKLVPRVVLARHEHKNIPHKPPVANRPSSKAQGRTPKASAKYHAELSLKPSLREIFGGPESSELHDLSTLRNELAMTRVLMGDMLDMKKYNQELQETLMEKQTWMSDECYHMTNKLQEQGRDIESEKESLQKKKTELEQVEKEKTDLMELKRQTQLKVLKYSHTDFMARVSKMVKLKDASAVIDYLTSLSHCLKKIHDKARQLEKKVNEQKSEVEHHKKQFDMAMRYKNLELLRLQRLREEIWNQTQPWESKLEEITNTESKKTLKLGQVRLSVLNLYETIFSDMKEDPGMDIENTEKQLEILWIYSKYGSNMVANIVKKSEESGALAKKKEAPQ